MRIPFDEWAAGALAAGLWPGAAPVAGAFVAAAFVMSAAVGVWLTVIDVRTHRLPNAIVLSALGVTILLLAASCLFGAPWGALLRALAAGAVLFVFFLALRVIGRGAMGGGDVKLAALMGVLLGWVGWSAVAVGVLVAFVLGGLVGVILLATRRASRATRIPFGPFLVAGTWIGALAAAG